ncbi:phospholipase D-like domain-containing protein, partial [Clostridium butyricum]|uniref:phospholipase D-like domain-containing protein n=1 Tax=Clostridium butyricum TaxID=1492 RepID=UPI0012695981
NINEYVKKDVNNLIAVLEKLILYFINDIKLNESLIKLCIRKLYIEFFYSCICGLQIIFLVIANDILNNCLIYRSSLCKYNLEERKEYIYNESREIIIQNIKNNSRYIKNIPYPDEELQMIAIKKDKSSFFDINKPSKNVVNYISNNDIKLLFRNDSQQNLDLLTELKVMEINELINKDIDNIIIKPHCFDIYIKAIFKVAEVKKVMIAVGFAYKSGIGLIEDELNSVICKNGKVELIIGTLQEYNSDKIVSNMDLDTAKKLNIMIQEGVKIRTNESCFYHGKIYCFIGEKYSFIIMGSTNLSRNAFRYNKELDSMFIFPNSHNVYVEWFEEFWVNSTKIDVLDEEKFVPHSFDSNDICDKQNSISIDEMKKQVSLITDEMLKNRLLLWLAYNPSNIYENILVANNEYVAIEYKEKSMIVLESFVQGNSYFVFYDIDIERLLPSIENKTKDEIFELSNMEKRGYHIREQLKLEIKIQSYFL